MTFERWRYASPPYFYFSYRWRRVGGHYDYPKTRTGLEQPSGIGIRGGFTECPGAKNRICFRSSQAPKSDQGFPGNAKAECSTYVERLDRWPECAIDDGVCSLVECPIDARPGRTGTPISPSWDTASVVQPCDEQPLLRYYSFATTSEGATELSVARGGAWRG